MESKDKDETKPTNRHLVSLTEKQNEEIGKRAAELGISIPEVIRRIIDTQLFGKNS